jgi:precorrin-6Y C5,15-methyltransferase (decarboxylating) CbiT subunit
MTKSEVRSVVLSKLRLRENDIVYDIGAGTGSVSVEAALIARSGHVYAFEREAEGCRLIRENALKLGASNLTVIEGSVPDTLNGLPVPDAVFIGGSGGSLDEIGESLLHSNPRLRLVVSAVVWKHRAGNSAVRAASADEFRGRPNFRQPLGAAGRASSAARPRIPSLYSAVKAAYE